MRPYNEKVLVVGTTPDYIDRIRCDHPGRALFLTDPKVRYGAEQQNPPSSEEILCDFSDYPGSANIIREHLKIHAFYLSGITCFDCESMDLAAYLGNVFDLPYPSASSVSHCRNKYVTNRLWRRYGICCPQSELIPTEADAVRFYHKTTAPCILKPYNGSGSELIFLCNSEDACKKNFHQIKEGIRKRQSSRMYASSGVDEGICLAEEMVNGEEFSCDFFLEDEKITIIRLSKKIISQTGSFGTARAYILLPSIEPFMDESLLFRTLHQCAHALGITRAMCMVDFIMREGKPVFLEMAPRPGGDCLPFLLKKARDLDMFKLNFDFASRSPVCLNGPRDTSLYVGLRIHSQNSGVLKNIRLDHLLEDHRIVEIHMIRKPGHLILMPPEDYDTWYMGHIIFKASTEQDIEFQCNDLIQKIDIQVEPVL